MGVPPPQFLPQRKAVPNSIFQIHVQKVDTAPTVPRRVQQFLSGRRGTYYAHVVVFHQNFPFQGGFELVADAFFIVAEID